MTRLISLPVLLWTKYGFIMKVFSNNSNSAIAKNDGNGETENCKPAGESKHKWNAVWKSDILRRKNSLFAILSEIAPWLVPYPSPFNYFLKSWIEEHLYISNMRILEIGGAGGLGVVLGRNSKEYVLIDYSEEAIQRARRVLRNVPCSSCILKDMFTYKPSELFDLVISLGLIEHFFGNEKKRCLDAHIRLSRRYVCIGAPADNPINWWNHFKYERTKEYPSQRPISEGELFSLCLSADLMPLAMTRLDSGYGRRKGMIRALLRRLLAARWPFRGWGKDRIDGGLVVMLAEKKQPSN